MYSFIISVGTIITSGVIFYGYFWTLFIVHLALKLFYPLKSDKLFKSDYSRIIFIAEILIVFLIGTLPSVLTASIGQNYRIDTHPPIYCGNYGATILYVLVLPGVILGLFSNMLILMIIYKLHIVSLMM